MAIINQIFDSTARYFTIVTIETENFESTREEAILSSEEDNLIGKEALDSVSQLMTYIRMYVRR